MIPFSPEVFHALFEQYNLAIWPAQLAAYVLGALCAALAFCTSRAGSAAIGLLVASAWVWNAIAYHWMTFAPVNFAAPVFAALFVGQGLLVFLHFVMRDDARLAFHPDPAGWYGVLLMGFAMSGYPLLAMLAGHGWPGGAMFGVAPCPTVIFTLGVLLLAQERVAWGTLIIPLVWCVIGGSAAWFLKVAEDASLPVAGLAAVVLAIVKNRRAP